MNNNFTQYELEQQETSNSFLSRVFMWMFAGLFLTAILSFSVATNEALLYIIYSNRILFYGLIIAEIGIVFFLSARAHKMSFAGALTGFMLYSALNGITLSVVLLAYGLDVVSKVFIGTALIFAVMAIYGKMTKTDLNAFRAFFVMGIVGMIIMSVINIFIPSQGMNLIIGYLGVAVFSGLTAYDIQKLKHFQRGSVKQAEGNMAIIGALMLYLDFINLFLSLLRIVGGRD